MRLKQGDRLGSRYPYRIVRRVGEGEGGQSYVYLAVEGDDVTTFRFAELVAIKIANVTDSRYAQFYERTLNNEVEILNSLSHPGIVRVYPIKGQTVRGGTLVYTARADLPGQPWFSVMEFLAGGSLSMLLKKHKPLEQGLAIRIALHVAHALAAVHEAGYVHLDLKPENIVFRQPLSTGKISPVLVDFGIARPVGRHGLEGGTFPYMPPERLAYKEALNRRAPEQVEPPSPHPTMDIYTLGLVVYTMVTGKLPFKGRKSQVTSAILSGQLTAPSVHRPDVDQRLEGLIMALLARDPSRRPPTGQVIEELERLATAHRTFRVPDWDPLSWEQRPTDKKDGGIDLKVNPRTVGAFVVVALAALALLGMGVLLFSSPTTATTASSTARPTATSALAQAGGPASPPAATSTPVPISAGETGEPEKSPSAGISVRPTSTPASGIAFQPTSTPVARLTASPTATPSPTPRSGDDANAGVSVQPPPPTPTPAPEERVEIRLLKPEPDEVTGNELVRFIVQPVGLKANQRLVLLLGRSGEPMRDHPVTWQFNGDIQAFVADVLGPPYGAGDYSWTAVAVDASGRRVGQGEVRRLTWNQPGSPAGEGSGGAAGVEEGERGKKGWEGSGR